MGRNIYDDKGGRYSPDCDRTTILLRLLADDMGIFSRLHSSEVDGDLLDRLVTLGFPESLAVIPERESAFEQYSRDVKRFLKEWKGCGKDRRRSVLREIVTDFASIFLTGICGVSPYESFYTSPTKELRSEAMFCVREIYERAGLEISDIKNFADDHAAVQMEFVGYIIHERGPAGITLALEVLEKHLALWYPEFVRGAEICAGGDFYKGVIGITQSYIQDIIPILKRIYPDQNKK